MPSEWFEQLAIKGAASFQRRDDEIEVVRPTAGAEPIGHGVRDSRDH
jgi:hypothetical protein